jgi:hypothetical protein
MLMTRLALYIAVGALFVATLPATATAQDKSRSEGFFLGVAFEGSGIVFEDEDSHPGAGFSATVGYGFNPKVSIYGHVSAANVDDEEGGDYGLGHFDIGTRLHFRAPAKTVVPFIQGGISARALKQDVGIVEVQASGVALSVGGGINAHFNPALAFNAGVVWSFGNMDFKVNGASERTESRGMTSARVQVGIVWFPQRK